MERPLLIEEIGLLLLDRSMFVFLEYEGEWFFLLWWAIIIGVWGCCAKLKMHIFACYLPHRKGIGPLLYAVGMYFSFAMAQYITLPLFLQVLLDNVCNYRIHNDKSLSLPS